MNAWDSLPNGKHIDAVLEFFRTHPYSARDAAWDAARDATRGAAWGAAWDAVRAAAWDAAWDAVRDAAWDAAWHAAWDATRDAAWGAARDATAALVAWDSAGDLFAADLSVVELAAHGGDHAAILLLPLKRVMEHAAKATGEAE